MHLQKAIAIFPRLISRSSLLSVAVAAALGSGAVAAHAGPCADQIAQLQKIAQSESPILPQKHSAQLHHEPSLRDVDEAENEAKAEAAAALARAQTADSENNAAACAEAVRDFKKLYALG